MKQHHEHSIIWPARSVILPDRNHGGHFDMKPLPSALQADFERATGRRTHYCACRILNLCSTGPVSNAMTDLPLTNNQEGCEFCTGFDDEEKTLPELKHNIQQNFTPLNTIL